MGPGAADIGEIVSEVRDKLPHLEPSPGLELEQARFRLFDSLTTFLKNPAQSQPLVLIIDVGRPALSTVTAIPGPAIGMQLPSHFEFFLIMAASPVAGINWLGQ